MTFLTSFSTYRIDGIFGVEFSLAVWRIGQPTAKLKTANIKSIYSVVEGVICGFLDDMALYRFFAKAGGMPMRVPSLSEKETKDRNTSVSSQERENKQQKSFEERVHNCAISYRLQDSCSLMIGVQMLP